MAYYAHFTNGDVSGGVYQCKLTLSDPSGWTMQAGEPMRAFVAPAAGDHGNHGGRERVGLATRPSGAQ